MGGHALVTVGGDGDEPQETKPITEPAEVLGMVGAGPEPVCPSRPSRHMLRGLMRQWFRRPRRQGESGFSGARLAEGGTVCSPPEALPTVGFDALPAAGMWIAARSRARRKGQARQPGRYERGNPPVFRTPSLSMRSGPC